MSDGKAEVDVNVNVSMMELADARRASSS